MADDNFLLAVQTKLIFDHKIKILEATTIAVPGSYFKSRNMREGDVNFEKRKSACCCL